MMLAQLTSLAHETSSDKRRDLMREVADLFVLDSGHYTDRELFLFGDILTSLLDGVDITAKIRLSKTVASVKETPRELAITLANQEGAVALPILEHSPVLDEEDLIKVANARSTDHRIAISKRANLSSLVTDSLIGHGERSVLRSVSENRTAEISDGGYSTLADHAANDSVLSESLSHRSDMPEQVMGRVLPLLSEQAQARLQGLVKAHGNTAVEALVEGASQIAKNTSQSSKRQHMESQVLLEKILDDKMDLEPVLELLCQEGRPLDLGLILAGVAKLPEQQVVNALVKTDGKAIIVLCRALDISEHTFLAIAKLRTQRLKQDPAVENRLLREFAELDVMTAKRTMRFVKVRETVASM